MTDGYFEAYTIVEGALEDERDFPNLWDAIEWLTAEARAALADGAELEGYILEHYHSADWDGECECAQYALDHRPIVTSAGLY
jgi:hypothetical protein